MCRQLKRPNPNARTYLNTNTPKHVHTRLPMTPPTDSIITIRGLRKSFGNLHVLRGVDLDVSRSENVVVLGRSGTGKSVLIKIIVGLLKPDAGDVVVAFAEELDCFEEDAGAFGEGGGGPGGEDGCGRGDG